MQIMTITQERIFRSLTDIESISQESARRFVVNAPEEILETIKGGFDELKSLYLSLRLKSEDYDPSDSEIYVEKEKAVYSQMLEIYHGYSSLN